MVELNKVLAENGDNINNQDKTLVVFQSKKIRRTWFKEEWHYSLVDIVQVLTDSVNPTDYLKKNLSKFSLFYNVSDKYT